MTSIERSEMPTAKLSERLDRLASMDRHLGRVASETIRAAAELARRVEGAQVEIVTRHAYMGPLALVDSDGLVGKRIALVPVDQEGEAS